MAMSVFRFARRTWASEDLEHIAPVPLPKMATPAVVLSSLVVIALLLFVSIGSLVWRQDPSQQWLSQISAGPSAPHSVRLIRDNGPWQPPVSEPVKSLVVHDANTEFVRLQWPQIEGVKRYRVYRASAHKAGLGLAIVGEICRAHQADISLHQVQPQGLRVRVEFAGTEP